MTEPKFMTPAHRRAYLTHLNRCKAMDSYHRALIYILTAVPALQNNIDACFSLHGRQHSISPPTSSCNALNVLGIVRSSGYLPGCTYSTRISFSLIGFTPFHRVWS